MRLAAFLPLAVLPFALATTHTVKVGVDKSDKPALVYTPDNLKPAKDDTIVFQFYSDDHSVAQSTFDKPCEYVDGGIFSSFPGPGKTFTITINDTKPVWLYCSEGGHCQRGQALALNAPQDQTLAQYKEAAQNANGGKSDLGPVSGGVIADVASNASSTTASGNKSTTATATSGTPESTGGSTATSSSTAASGTSTGAASRFTAGAGLGAMGLLGFLVGGMI